MKSLGHKIEASKATIEDDVVIGANSILRGDEVVLRKGARIGDRVEIICDGLEVGPGCTIGSNSVILCPQVAFEQGCSIGTFVHAELNQHFYLGRFCHISQRVGMLGQGVESGEFLFLDRDIVIGGGGARGPRSFLTIGGRTSIFAKSCINLSEEVRIGSNVGISYNVALLTHNAWQPVLRGYTARFAPISIEDNATIYLNVIVLPGVTIGEWSTVGAGSIVVRDVPPYCLAAGNPARVVKGPHGYPPPLDRKGQDSLIGTILADYLTTLAPKGVKVVRDALASENYAVVEFEGRCETICYIPEGGCPHSDTKADITLSCGSIGAESRGMCHFDLAAERMTGEPTRIAEDLRDYLRRHAIRIFTDGPFQSLPLVNLQRLQRRRQGK